MDKKEILKKLKEIRFWNEQAITFHDRVALDEIDKIVKELIRKLESSD